MHTFDLFHDFNFELGALLHPQMDIAHGIEARERVGAENEEAGFIAGIEAASMSAS